MLREATLDITLHAPLADPPLFFEQLVKRGWRVPRSPPVHCIPQGRDEFGPVMELVADLDTERAAAVVRQKAEIPEWTGVTLSHGPAESPRCELFFRLGHPVVHLMLSGPDQKLLGVQKCIDASWYIEELVRALDASGALVYQVKWEESED